MSADNDLSADALSDIEEMKKGYRDNGIHLIVFADLARSSLFIRDSRIPENSKNVSEINSANAYQMQEVLNDIVNLYPAHSYGLVYGRMAHHGFLQTYHKSFGRIMEVK